MAQTWGFLKEIMGWWGCLNGWLKAHDISNWLAIAFTAVLWPSLLYWYYNRKIQSIPHLEVLLTPTQTAINGHPYNAVGLIFTNRTGTVVYLHRVRLRECAERFSIPPAAIRDISGGWREIKFENGNGRLEDQERVLHTNQSANTSIAVMRSMVSEFYSYQPQLLRRLFKRPKYFVLEYTAMIGEKKYSVATIY
jgi:hypothetical protein